MEEVVQTTENTEVIETTEDTILGHEVEEKEVIETTEETTEETEEQQEEEINIDFSKYGEAYGIEEEDFNNAITELLGENPSNRDKEIVNKILDKLATGEGERGRAAAEEQQATYNDITSNPPVEDMKGLNAFIVKNPELKELAGTMTSAKLPNEVIRANIKVLDMLRKGQVGTTGTGVQGSVGKITGAMTKEKVKEEYENIVKTKTGHKRDIAIKDLKKKAMATGGEVAEFTEVFL